MASEPEAFFQESNGLWIPTELCRGPWSPDHQHGGPPAALLTRALERVGLNREEAQIARMSVEFLRPVPLSPLRVTAELLRPGKKVELAGAEQGLIGRSCQSLLIDDQRGSG